MRKKRFVRYEEFSISHILTVKLTFACVSAAEGHQRNHTDEQDTTPTYCSPNNYQHR